MKRALLVAAALGLACGGCINGVGWLPDSKGFVLTVDGGKLIHFDVATRKSRVLNGDTGCNTYWPAVSPDGKQIALARLTFDDRRTATLRVILHDLDGKKIHESPDFSWGTYTKDRVTDANTTTMLFWSRDGGKLLVYGSTQATYGTTGVYDPKTRKMKQWENTLPYIAGGSPVRPDGAGFLLTQMDRTGEDVERIDFVDWEGRKKKIDLRFAAKEDHLMPHLTWACLRWSFWERDVAVCVSKEGTTRLDTGKAVGVLEKTDRKLLEVDKELVWMKTTLESGVHVLVLTPQKEAYKSFRVITLDPDTGRRETIVERGQDRLLGLFPAPDRKHVVLRISEGDRKGPDADFVHLIDNRGRLAHTIDVFDAFRPGKKPE